MRQITPTIILLLLLAGMSLKTATNRTRSAAPSHNTREEFNQRTQLASKPLLLHKHNTSARDKRHASHQTSAPVASVGPLIIIDDMIVPAGGQSMTTIDVPIPTTTPFDDVPAARRAYIKYYDRGYRLGYMGTVSTCCMFGGSPMIAACVEGHYDGQREGMNKSMISGPVHDRFVKSMEAAGEWSKIPNSWRSDRQPRH